MWRIDLEKQIEDGALKKAARFRTAFFVLIVRHFDGYISPSA